MTILEVKSLIKQLESENDESNKEWIDLLNRRIIEVTAKATDKFWRKFKKSPL